MPGTPILGARYYEEFAPNAQDRGEIVSMGETLAVPFGTFDDVLQTEESNALEPGSVSEKFWAPGIGVIKDEELELVGHERTGLHSRRDDALPQQRTLSGPGRLDPHRRHRRRRASHPGRQRTAASSGSSTRETPRSWSKCSTPVALHPSNSYWVFAAGLTDVEVTVEVLDTETGQLKEYDNDASTPFQPVLDTGAFDTCP